MERNPDEPWTQLATRIPKDLLRKVKLHCIQRDTTVMAFVVDALEQKLAKATQAPRPRNRRRAA